VARCLSFREMGSTIKLNWNFIPITGKRFAAGVFKFSKKENKNFERKLKV
jgi:hypothetical protein